MRFVRALVFVVIATFGGSIHAQDLPQPRLFDEVGDTCSEDIMARMDAFLAELYNDPSASGLIVLYGREDSEGRNQRLAEFASTIYPKRRGFRTALPVVHGPRRENLSSQFWIVPAGASLPAIAPWSSSEAVSRPHLFDRSWIGFNRETGVLDIYSDGFLVNGCGFSPNRALVADKLKSSPELNAFLIIYTERRNTRLGKKLAAWAKRDLVKNFNVRSERITAVYGGTRGDGEIEFWLVPEGTPNPSPRKGIPPMRPR